MPDTTTTLTMLREAFDLGLLPDTWHFAANTIDVILDGGGVAIMRGRSGYVINDRVVRLLLDHLASLGLRCIHEPPWGAGQHGYWRVQAPYPDGRNALAAGPSDPRWMASEADIQSGGEYPGVLGLLAAAVAAERWRRAQEADARDAT